MSCEFKKQNGEDKIGNGQPPVAHPEVKRTVYIPKQTELDRRRCSHKEQPKDPRKKPNKS